VARRCEFLNYGWPKGTYGIDLAEVALESGGRVATKRQTRRVPAKAVTAKKRKVGTRPKNPPEIEESIEVNGLPLLVWGVRLSAYFLALGGIVLLVYAVKGFGTDPNSFPLGFRVDLVVATIYFVLGVAGSLIGFFMPRFSLRFVPVFAAVVTALAVLGTFFTNPFGMQLSMRDSTFHWAAAALAWVLWFYAKGQEREQV